MAEYVASAGVAALGAKEVFDYNRSNFMEDREQRMKKEFKEFSFRVEQGKLWRQDIRDIVGLVEKKTKAYLQVCVFMLGFTVSLWCQGRLPENTPSWLMLGNQIGIGGSFTFLLLTVWLATHASVAAQAYEARLLTQMVRLPVPTWEELEACRTYGSSFEQVESKQMFRVPFLMGKQESLVKNPTPSPEVADYGGVGFSGGSPDVSTDPWGLERRGDNTFELGPHYGAAVGKLRHIKLVRQAAHYWQNYDAFARISMSIGVNQLMLATSYFILGYMLIHLRAPYAAFGGVIILMGTAVAIANLDMSLPREQHFVIIGLLVAGPSLSCLATYHWGQTSELGEQIGRVLAPGAFFSHGLLVMLLTYFCRIRDTNAGGMMPTAFRISLYLDIFGWLKEDLNEDTDEVGETAGPRRQISGLANSEAFSRQASSISQWSVASPIEAERVPQGMEVAQKGLDLKPYAMDYLDHQDSLDAEPDSDAAVRRRYRPALNLVQYDSAGLPVPTRPEDAAPPGTVDDLRNVPGAPREKWDPAIDGKEPTRDFFRPTTFFPAAADDADSKRRLLESSKTLETGHDRDRPGILPWKVFRSATILLGAVWMLAALYALLDAVVLDVLFESLGTGGAGAIVALQVPAGTSVYAKPLEPVVPKPTLVELLRAGFGRIPPGPEPERVTMSWPHSGQPQGLSCDAVGRHFVLTDGVSIMSAEIAQSEVLPPVLKQNLRSLRPGIASPAMNFEEASRCTALQGQRLLDTAVRCPGPGSSDGNGSVCQVLVLHKDGHRVAACDIHGSGSSMGRGTPAQVSQAWLQGRTEETDPETKEEEKVSWLVLDAKCAGRGKSSALDCTSVGTTHGRLAHLQHAASSDLGLGDVLFPDDVLPESSQLVAAAPKRTSKPGVVRAFGSQFLGVLQGQRQSIHVLDVENDLAEVGSLMLPVSNPVTSFCAGGGYVYLLTEGQKPELWRLPLPKRLK